MRIEINDSLASVLMTGVIVVGIVGTILGVGYMIHDNSVKSMQAVNSAKTCEEAVLLQNGGADTTNRIIACKLQVQTVAPVIQGK